jgi:pSer/pThr/pTyr-binding forkhead associated (FHA) protein
MAKLILSMDGLVLKEIPLIKERTTIGRKPHNDIQIDNLAISGEHAVIVNILNDSFLEDLNSTNGTYVNGQPIKKHFLQANDTVELGKYKLKFLSDAHAQSGSDYEKTMLLRRGGAARAAVEGASPAAAPAAPAVRSAAPSVDYDRAAAAPAEPASNQGEGALQILTGSRAGKELGLVKTLTTVGKPGVQVAVIARRPQGFFITHVEGVKFPSVNGRPLDAQAHLLKEHDVIELAGVRMEFFLRK